MKPAGRTFRLVYLAILAALAVALHVIEALLPMPYVFPGAKLGLANVVALYLVLSYGPAEAVAVTGLRTVLGSLLSGTFLNLAFLLSLSGGLVSTAVMAALSPLPRRSLSPIGISIAGAVTHNLTQLAVAVAVTRQAGLALYLPVLLGFALPTGLLNGLIARRLVILQDSLISRIR